LAFSSVFVSIFGLILGLRTLSALCFRLHFDQSRTSQLQIVVTFVIVLLSLVLREHLFLQILITTAIFLTPLLIDLAVFHHRSHYFRQEIVSFLDGLLLQMRLGRSFKDSIQNNLPGRPAWFEKEFQLFVEALSLRQKFSGVIANKAFFHELEQVATTPVKQIDRLKSFRRKLKIEDDFRQKSRKALLQVRAQSALLCLMYVPIFIFQIVRGVMQQAPLIMLVSAVLFVFGTVWIANAGRRYKWKI
jgi:Flp pilus assembly protein TadB